MERPPHEELLARDRSFSIRFALLTAALALAWAGLLLGLGFLLTGEPRWLIGLGGAISIVWYMYRKLWPRLYFEIVGFRDRDGLLTTAEMLENQWKEQQAQEEPEVPLMPYPADPMWSTKTRWWQRKARDDTFAATNVPVERTPDKVVPERCTCGHSGVCARCQAST